MSTRDTNKNYVQTHKSNAEAFYPLQKKKITTITQKFTDFTILLIEIVFPQNKIRVHITKTIHISDNFKYQ